MEHNKKTALKTILISLSGSMLLVIIKTIAGILGHSFALIADAIESTGDVFSSLLVYIGLRYSTKPPDKAHPYGHGKAEPLFTFMVVGFLVISATIIAYESIINIRTPHQIPKTFTLYVLGCIIVFKEIFYQIEIKKSKETHSTSLAADAWHHRSDAISSFFAFIGISIAIIMGQGYESADDWAALIASGIIIYNAYLIFRPALGEILDEHAYHDMEKIIRNITIEVEGVIETEKCYIRKTGMVYFIDLHAIVNGDITVRQGHTIAHNIKNTIKEKLPEVADILIHIEPN